MCLVDGMVFGFEFVLIWTLTGHIHKNDGDHLKKNMYPSVHPSRKNSCAYCSGCFSLFIASTVFKFCVFYRLDMILPSIFSPTLSPFTPYFQYISLRLLSYWSKSHINSRNMLSIYIDSKWNFHHHHHVHRSIYIRDRFELINSIESISFDFRIKNQMPTDWKEECEQNDLESKCERQRISSSKTEQRCQ